MADRSDTYTFEGLDSLLKIIDEQAALRAKIIPDPVKAGEFLQSVAVRRDLLAGEYLEELNFFVKETIEEKVPVTIARLIAKMRRQLALLGKEKEKYVERADECLDEIEKGLLHFYLDPAKEQEHQKVQLAATEEMCIRSKPWNPYEGIRAHTAYSKKIIESLWKCAGAPLKRQINKRDIRFGTEWPRSLAKGDILENWSPVIQGICELYVLFLPVFIDPLSNKPVKVPQLLCQLITDLIHYVRGLEDYPLRKTKAVIHRRLREARNPGLEQLYEASGDFFIPRLGDVDAAIMYPYAETVKKKELKLSVVV